MFKSITRTKRKAAVALFAALSVITAIVATVMTAYAQTETVFDNMGAGTVTDSDGFIDSPEGTETVSGLVGVDSGSGEPSNTVGGTQGSPMDSGSETSLVDGDGDTSSLAGIIIAIVIVVAVIIIVVALVPKKKQ